MGASNTYRALNGEIDDLKAAALAAYPGFTGLLDVINAGVEGLTTGTMAEGIDALLATYPAQGADGYRTTVVWEIGGNNVSDNRPYSTDTQLVQMAADLDYIDSAIRAKGFVSVLSDLTFRDYIDRAFAQEQIGSRPYNVNLMRPRVDAAWKYPSGKPFVQLYDLIRNNYLTYLDADNIHQSTDGKAAIRQHWIDTVFKKQLTGVDPTEIAPNNAVTVKAHTWSGGSPAEPTGWFRATSAPNAINTAALDAATGVDTGWDFIVDAAFAATGNTGTTTGANTGIVPDYVLTTFAAVDNTINNGAGLGAAAYRLANLDDTRLYTLRMTGARNTAGSRITKFTVNGDTAGAQSLETIGNTANEVVFSNVSPIGGEITVLVEQVNHQFGYHNAVQMTQLAG